MRVLREINGYTLPILAELHQKINQSSLPVFHSSCHNTLRISHIL